MPHRLVQSDAVYGEDSGGCERQQRYQWLEVHNDLVLRPPSVHERRKMVQSVRGLQKTRALLTILSVHDVMIDAIRRQSYDL